MSIDQLTREFLRAQRRGGVGFNLADWGRLAAWLFLIGAACFWMPIEWQLVVPRAPADMVIAIAFGAFMTVGPAVIVSSFIPSSRAGRLLLKLNLATPGKVVGIGSGLFLTWHAYQVLYAWWAARPSPDATVDLSVNAAGLTWQMAIVGIICTIIYPALMFAPVSREELSEQVEQAEQVELYEIATRNRIAGIMAAHERALDLFAKGLANMTVAERGELADYMGGVVHAIDESRRRFAGQIEARTGVAMQYESLTGDRNLVPYLHYITQALRGEEAEEVTAAAHIDSRLQSSIPREHESDSARQGPALSDDDRRTYEAVRSRLPVPFTAQHIADLMDWKDKRSGQRVIKEWLRVGLIEEVRMGRYRLTEREG